MANDIMMMDQSMATRDPAGMAAAEGAKARIQAKFIMAMHRPRSEDDARVAILLACKRPAFAERVEYSKPVGNTKIKGMSIRFVETAGRLWKNLDTETQVVYEDDNVRRTRITTTDLETNVSYTQEVVVAKTVERRKAGDDREVLGERVNTQGQKVYILRATEEELSTKENAQFSKVIRNQILRLIPADIIDEARDTAIATLRAAGSGDPQAAKKKVMDSFASLGIRPRDLAEYLGHNLEVMAPKELEELRGIYAAIRDGEASWQDYVAQGGNAAAVDIDPPDTSEFDALATSKTQGDEANFREFDDFLAVTAKKNGVTVAMLKVQAIPQFESLWNAFTEWRKTQGKQDAPTQKASSPDDALIAEFANLRTPGFTAYVRENLDRIGTFPPDVRKEFEGKYLRIFGKPFDADEWKKEQSQGEKEVSQAEFHESIRRMVFALMNPLGVSPDKFNEYYMKGQGVAAESMGDVYGDVYKMEHHQRKALAREILEHRQQVEQADSPGAGPFGEQREIYCPNRDGKEVPASECGACKDREGCPEWR